MSFSKQKMLEDPDNYSMTIPVHSLSSFIELCIEKYEEDVPLVSDTVYDIMYDSLKKRDPNNTLFNKVGYIDSKDNKVELPYYMGSMNKIKTITEIKLWAHKHNGPYIVSGKLDGASALLEQKNGEQKLYSRGNGYRGKDISHLIPFLEIPTIQHDYCVRGELIVSKKNFKTNNLFITPRSMVNGMVNRKNIDNGNNIDFVVFEVIYYGGNRNIFPDKQMTLSKKLGFKTTIHKQISHSQLVDLETIETSFILGLLLEYRQHYDYDIDGIIITNNQPYSCITEGNPKYSVAFKSNGLGKITSVKNIEWNVSKHKYLIPRIKIEPIVIDGNLINYTTGFNAKFIKDNYIGVGSKIRVVRSGDVIPYIIEIITKSVEPCFPDKNYIWTDSGVNIIETGESGELKQKQVVYFFKTIGVENISEGIIRKLFLNNYDSIKKIINVTQQQLLQLDGFQKILSEKIYKSIHKVIDHPVNIVKLMVASLCFGRGFGYKKIEKVTSKYPDILEITLTPDMLNELEGFSTKTSQQFVDSLTNFKLFMVEHPFIKIDIPKKKNTGNKFKNIKIAMTGFRNKTISELIENNGGIISSSLTKNTDMLIIKDENSRSSKTHAAELLGIPIITLEDFIIKYN